jgi:hypothetical protein
MESKNKKKLALKDVCIILGIVALLLFKTRLWPLLLLVLLALLVIGIYKLFLSLKQQDKPVEEAMPQTKPQAQTLPVFDIVEDWYGVLCMRITELVKSEYLNAKWVWEKPNSRNRIMMHEEVYILLNQAGGYRKARVQVRDYQAEGLEFVSAPCAQIPKHNVETAPIAAEETQPIKTDYSLLAMEWVTERAMLINERCNEAIGRKETQLVLTVSELPTEKESWANIVDELKKIGLENVEVETDGIKIDLSNVGMKKE